MNSADPSYLREFLDHIHSLKRYSQHTKSNYRRDILQFLEFLTPLRPQDLHYETVRKYILELKKKGYKESSIHRKGAALKSFYKYLHQKKYIDQNPFKNVVLPKKPVYLPSVLSDKEMAHFLDHLCENTPIDQRNKALFEMLYSSGLRISELVNLKCHQIDWNNNTLRVTGKGNKERIVIFGNTCKRILEHYYTHVRPLWCKDNTESLFLNTKGTQLTQRSVQRILLELTRKSGLQKHITPHTLRHSFASSLYNGGANLRNIQELLGHKNLSTTQIYTHVSNKKLKDDYSNALPLG